MDAYETGLDRNPANHVPLTPLSFLARAAAVYPERTAVIHGALRLSYAEMYARARRLASALKARGIGLGDTVAIMAPNVPAMLEAHYGVPMVGAVLNTLNTRLDAPSIAFILDHAEAKVLITDRVFAPIIEPALAQAKARPLVIDIDDPLGPEGELLGDTDYEAFIAGGDPSFPWAPPDDEWRAISLNYTSGTTGNPKGVVYHHRGAYLNAIGNLLSWGMRDGPRYLWTLPMFHCNGWCFTWSVSIVAGTHVCLRKLDARSIYAAIVEHGITHFCGAPIVLGMVINAKPEERLKLDHQVEVMTAAAPAPPDDEWRAISLNYTSGTTGNPKGVVYHHRGAYLNAIGNLLSWGMGDAPRYLWTLPMFHCNGWCFTWSISIVAGTHVCLRRIDARSIYAAIKEHGITHFCGAPIVLGMVINAKPEERLKLDHRVEVLTAAAPPPPVVLRAMQEQGFRVTHVYGLTETYGPDTVCAWKGEWDALPIEEQASLKARQGVAYAVQEAIMVADPATMKPVPADGATMGEVMHRGNVTMKGYLKNPKATAEAFAGGWFRSGDLAVTHPDGYIEVRDRAKDIIISGGENISTIEVEGILYKHPAVLEAAVVARPDAKWGETPCAFVTLKEGRSVSAEEIIAFCRDNMAHFKVPRTVVFASLPKTSTGKVQKYVLRDRAKALGDGD